jgi:thiosulfate dehydrogenase
MHGAPLPYAARACKIVDVARRGNVGKFILGLIVGVVLLAGGGMLYFVTGMAPAATSAPPMPMEKWMARHALNARIEREAPKTAAIPASEANVVAGVDVYRMNCALCHGLPNRPETTVARGEYPHPPQLFRGKGVTDDPPGETYWKVKNGIRLTGMPSFSSGLTDTEMWQVSQMLATADKLPPAAQQALGLIAAAPAPAPEKK